MNPAGPGRMLKRLPLSALRDECLFEGRASVAAVYPIDGALSEAYGSAPRLASEDSGHLRDYGCSRHEKALHDGGTDLLNN